MNKITQKETLKELIIEILGYFFAGITIFIIGGTIFLIIFLIFKHL